MNNQWKVYLKKTIALLPAVVLLAFGISLSLSAGLGADLYTSFQEGLAVLAGTDVGTMNTIFNVCITLVFLVVNRRLINIGSLVMCAVVGPCMTIFIKILDTIISGQNPAMGIRILISCIGTVLIALALSWYILLDVGLQPMDMIVATIAKALKKTYGIGSYVFNVLLLIGCLLVGSTIGIGTIINFACIGKLVDFFMPKMKPIINKVLR